MMTRRVRDISGVYRPVECASTALAARHAAVTLWRRGCPLEYLQCEAWSERRQRWEPYGAGMMAADDVVDFLDAGPKGGVS